MCGGVSVCVSVCVRASVRACVCVEFVHASTVCACIYMCVCV